MRLKSLTATTFFILGSMSAASFAQSRLLVDMTPHAVIEQTANALFDNLPAVRVGFENGECGAGEGVNPKMAYCTTENVILLREDSRHAPREAYELAHLYGHAVQVRHGVADIALREILTRPEEEAKLRGWVTRQVECIAGFIYAQSGLPAFSLTDAYVAEPLTGSHWGRDPLVVGPKVSIGLDARAAWFDRGVTSGLSGCAVGEFGAELLLEALR